jgi:hypothetical protein
MRTGGIEPPTQAWQAHVLPLYYARVFLETSIDSKALTHFYFF